MKSWPRFIINGFPERTPHIMKELEKWQCLAENTRLISPPILIPANALPCTTWRDPHQGRLLTQGELKCSLGHYAAWKAIAEDSTIKQAIILEDDAEILQGKPLPAFDPSFTDLLFLGYKIMDEQATTPIPDPLGNLPAPYVYWAIGYILSRSAAIKLTQAFLESSIIPTDEFLPYHYGQNPNVHTLHHAQSKPLELRAALAPIPVVTPSGKWKSETEESPSAFQVKALLFGTDWAKLSPTTTEYKNLGYEVSRVGQDMNEWDTNKTGGFQKIPAYLEHITSTLTPTEAAKTILLMADGYDTLPVEGPDMLLQRFAEMNTQIVVSGELKCWPDENLAPKFEKPTVTAPYTYPNSGLIMGHAGMLTALLRDMIATGERVYDQLALHKAIIKSQLTPNIRIDKESYLFQSLYGAQEQVRRHQGRPLNTATKCYPAILHANGPSTLEQTKPMTWNTPSLHPDAFQWIEVAPGILHMRFLDETTTTDLAIAATLTEPLWQPLPGDNVPGDELRLNLVDLAWWHWFEDTLKKNLAPILSQRWRPSEWSSLKDLFLIRYTIGRQPSIRLHNDISRFSCSIRIRAANTGGQLYFPYQNFSDILVANGDLLVWPARITHPHKVEPVRQGNRTSLVVWTQD